MWTRYDSSMASLTKQVMSCWEILMVLSWVIDLKNGEVAQFNYLGALSFSSISLSSLHLSIPSLKAQMLSTWPFSCYKFS